MTLRCSSLTAGRAKVPVVWDLDLEVPAGKVLGLLGPNGAGKTTVLLTLAGLLPRISGEVEVGGVALPNARPRRANSCGLVLVPDDRSLFGALSVEQNVRVASGRKQPGSFDAMVDLFPVLGERRRLRAGALSGGEQQMLAMARALVQRPRVLLIDEMSMGLAPVIAAELLATVRGIADQTQTAIVLVEQHVQLALEVCDLAVVLSRGRANLRGSSADLLNQPELLEAAYLGESAIGA